MDTRHNKLGSWKYIKNRSVREWTHNKERERLGLIEKKVGKSGHVYVFYTGYKNYFKIGCTSNLEKRLKDFRAANPFCSCAWSGWVKNMHEVESDLHRRFKKHKVEREIYSLSFEQIEKINEIVSKIQEDY